MSKNYYETLKILPYASLIEIKKAYHRLAFQYHPDLNPDNPLSEEQFKEISQAYEILKDSGKRLHYDLKIKRNNIDEKRRNTVYEDNTKNVSDFLNEFWQGFYGGGSLKHNNKPVKGEDIRLNLKLPIEKAILGGKIGIEAPHYFFCPKCGKNKVPVAIRRNCKICMGKGEIRITKKLYIEVPSGSETGTRLKINRQGKPGRNGGYAGDIYIVLNVQ
ncbi:MAG: DnaJ domain-containing protein [Thermodesulfobacteriota bacterium]|nr:DnaJ domain-containing protein [Thermodesulfobacteriota bacterium]